MIVGYVFSRKDKKEISIHNEKPPDLDKFNKKIYELLKDYVFKPTS